MKRAIALLLSLMLAFSCLPLTALAAFSDEAVWPSHASWAKKEIDYMVGKGVLNGYAEDNSFHPEWSVTRVQFIKMMVEAFGLTATTSISYADLPATHWAYPYVAKAAAQGFLLNYGTHLNPDGDLTRQEAAALLARYLKMEDSEKVAVNTYPDYASIRVDYRDYVLQASYAGLFSGDAESGNFSPDRVLKRCEAAAILYRAAGTIYKASASGTDYNANETNAVIGKSGITVTGATIKGKLLITEGASGGTVTLSGCDVETIIVRGTASLVLSGCAVNKVIVEPSATGVTSSVSLSNSTSVSSLIAKKPTTVNTVSGTLLKQVTVESTAANSSVKGAGTVSDAIVKASGVTADMMPAKYTVSGGNTAVFKGISCTGSSDDVSVNGFYGTPTTSLSSAACYLSAKPKVTGTLYYYFTNNASAPAATAYENYYKAADVKSYLTVSANSSVEQKLGESANVTAYAYVVLMLKATQGTSHQPVLIENKVFGGFEGTPVISDDGYYDQLSFKAMKNGNLYYYYTNTAAAPTAEVFSSTYNKTETVCKGTIDAIANQPDIVGLYAKSKVSAYAYVAVLLTDAQGQKYQPIVLNRDGTGAVVAGSGFTATPYSDVSTGNIVMLGLTASVNGTVDYYFTNTATVPTSAQFDDTFDSLSDIMIGSASVKSGTAYYSSFENQVVAKSMTYLVARLRASNGTKYQPVVVTLPNTTATTLANTYFTTMPQTGVVSGLYTITAQSSITGKLYYYLTNNERAPASSAVFTQNYNAATATDLASATGGMAVLAGGSSQLITTTITTTAAADFKYMALMIEVGNVGMTPILIPMITVKESASVAVTSGFTKEPVFTKESSKRSTLSMIPSVKGTIWYYFTSTTEIPAPEDLAELIKIERSNNSGYGNTATAFAGQSKTIELTDLLYYPPYVIVMLQGTDGMYYTPVILSTAGTTSGTTGTTTTNTGFTATPTAQKVSTSTVLSYNAQTAGVFYYYFTTSSVAPTTSQDFSTRYMAVTSSTMKGQVTVAAAGNGTQILSAPTGYNYIALMFQKTVSGQTSYCTPIVIPANSTGVIAGSSPFIGTPTVKSGVLTYNPAMTGTLRYCFTDANNDTDFTTELAGYAANTAFLSMISGRATVASLGQKTVSIVPSSSVSMLLNVYKYVALWIESGSTKTSVVFIPNGTSSTTTTPTNTGLTTTPSVTTAVSGLRQISLTPTVSGSVQYFFTNSTSAYTSSTFSTGYTFSGNGQTIAAVTAGLPTTISATSSYKYMWIMVTAAGYSYDPVMVTVN